MTPSHSSADGARGGVYEANDLILLTACRDFSKALLATAVGSTSGEVPALPAFYKQLPRAKTFQDVSSVDAMVDYAKVGEHFVMCVFSDGRARLHRPICPLLLFTLNHML